MDAARRTSARRARLRPFVHPHRGLFERYASVVLLPLNPRGQMVMLSKEPQILSSTSAEGQRREQECEYWSCLLCCVECFGQMVTRTQSNPDPLDFAHADVIV